MNSEDGSFVDDLESACEEVLREVVEEHFDGVSQRTIHLMAKAAVAVLEAVVDDAEVV